MWRKMAARSPRTPHPPIGCGVVWRVPGRRGEPSPVQPYAISRGHAPALDRRLMRSARSVPKAASPAQPSPTMRQPGSPARQHGRSIGRTHACPAKPTRPITGHRDPPGPPRYARGRRRPGMPSPRRPACKTLERDRTRPYITNPVDNLFSDMVCIFKRAPECFALGFV
jgi:hypothetical protein